MDAVKNFIDGLARYTSEHVFNPWRDYDPRYDIGPEAPAIRRQNLYDYLRPRLGRAKYMIVAEAVGYQGGRFTGIAITCERMLLNWHKSVGSDVVLGHAGMRTSSPTSDFITKQTQKDKGFNEPTDTVVWGSLLENNIDPRDVLLWNIFPFHPHRADEPLSNRTPTPDELKSGFPYTAQLIALSAAPTLLAVGKSAAGTLADFGIQATALRHPANGGGTLYREQFRAVVENNR